MDSCLPKDGLGADKKVGDNTDGSSNELGDHAVLYASESVIQKASSELESLKANISENVNSNMGNTTSQK